MPDDLAARLADTGDTLVIRGHGTRMQVVALGEDRPIAPNAKPDGSDDPEGRARNRRVDIEIIPAAAAPGDAGGRPAPPTRGPA